MGLMAQGIELDGFILPAGCCCDLCIYLYHKHVGSDVQMN
jgi:hypothetical protein